MPELSNIAKIQSRIAYPIEVYGTRTGKIKSSHFKGLDANYWAYKGHRGLGTALGHMYELAMIY